MFFSFIHILYPCFAMNARYTTLLAVLVLFSGCAGEKTRDASSPPADGESQGSEVLAGFRQKCVMSEGIGAGMLQRLNAEIREGMKNDFRTVLAKMGRWGEEIEDVRFQEAFQAQASRGVGEVTCTQGGESHLLYMPENQTDYLLIVHEAESSENEKYYHLAGYVKENDEWARQATYIQMASIGGLDYTDFQEKSVEAGEAGNLRLEVFYQLLSATTSLNNKYVKSLSSREIWRDSGLRLAELDARGHLDEFTFDDEKIRVYSLMQRQARDENGTLRVVNIKYVSRNLSDEARLNNMSMKIAESFSESHPGFGRFYNGVLVTAAEKMPGITEHAAAYNRLYAYSELAWKKG